MLDQLNIIRGVSELANQGGPIVLAIFALGVLMWAMIAERIWYFWRVLPRQVTDVRTRWDARGDHDSWCARQIREALISQVNVSMTSGFPILGVLVPMAPLLGLIGTVTGMLQVFSSMALLGTADARSMAAGVSAAMICTVSGLTIAVSGLYPVHYFRTRAVRETERLADELSL